MKIKDDIIDELLEQHQPGEDLFGSEGLVSQLTKRLMERILEAEMSNHLGYERGERTTAGKSGNTRNGKSPKRVKTLHGELQLDVPRDRDSSFEPQIVRKHQRRLKGFDDRVLSLYSRGMTVREIQGHLEELYQVEVSPDLISQATHAVWEDIQAWRNRPLQAVWPIVYLDARKYIKNRGHFPDDKSALKLIYLALRNAEKKWTMPIRNWKLALNQLAIKFEGRLPL